VCAGCSGGTCQAGVCQVFTVAEDEGLAHQLVVHGDAIYWLATKDGYARLRRRHLSNTGPVETLLEAGPLHPPVFLGLEQMVLDDTAVLVALPTRGSCSAWPPMRPPLWDRPPGPRGRRR
jgi:hypothetical protein